MANPFEELLEQGQSVWLDYIRRGLITSGELGRMMRDYLIRGVTSNPTIFQKAITGSHDYDEAFGRLAQGDHLSPYEAYLEVCGEDIRMTADVLRTVYETSDGRDGFVSFEAQAAGTQEMYEEAKRMFALVGRPNLMIKIPGVDAGVETVERLIADGINVNITLLFSVAVYERFANAYIAGLERRLAAGQPVDKIASVASFFVSRVDTKVDALLPENSPLRGRVAVANARSAYAPFDEIFGGERWKRLAEAGARVQRPLWASTGTKNPAYSDVLYVEELVAPYTVNTMPEATILAFLDHGKVRRFDEAAIDDAEEVLRQAAAAGIDLDRVTAQLLEEGLASFEKDFDALLDAIGKALSERSKARTVTGKFDVETNPSLVELKERIERRFDLIERHDVLNRIWRHDHTVWKDDPTEITRPNRLGWLTIAEGLTDEVPRLKAFAEDVAGQGFKTAVLLGMGGSSLAPEVMFKTLGKGPGGLDLEVLDTTVPAEILRLEEDIDLEKTLFIVASKSGTTLETLSHLAYFWEKCPDGSHFIAITDPGTPLEGIAREKGFRRIFLNPESLGGRYSALSYFGLVPAALIGADLRQILESAAEAESACHHCLPARENPGARLGVTLGEAVLNGQDKLTLLLPPELAPLGDWIEQLIAESTGKEATGIVPVVGEPIGPPAVYGTDRIFVAAGEHPGLDALEAAGHPIVHLPKWGKEDLGAAFFLWEFATAVAGHVLGINPFDQPNVQEAKDATNRVLASGGREPAISGDLEETFRRIAPGNYIAMQAYLPRFGTIRKRLAALRLKMRDRFVVATTLGSGPRYLHSTGQIHKGGPPSGVFIQFVEEDGGPDVSIPGRPYSFGRLNRAQADGDFETLKSGGHRVVRTSIEKLEEALR